MARASTSLIHAMRRAARKLSAGAAYQWGHMGRCNCGHLAQELCHISPADIHAHALRSRPGDWAEQSVEYCPGSGLPIDVLIDSLLQAGLSRRDLQQLERLSNPRVLACMGVEQLQHNHRPHVIAYLLAWAEMLEAQLPAPAVELPTQKQLSPIAAPA
ncbi:MAG: hypothetical protein D6730_14810 [Bacteroidetes bacterium]|nr:MAG: hypothetical protein D6730_14810 [Bacteroidota bacterium]